MNDRSQNPKRVLIVDDEPEIGRILAMILHTAGFDAAAVSGGRAALGRLGGEPPTPGFDAAAVSGGRAALARLAEPPADLVILDVVMPEPDGFETLRRLREA